MLTNDDIIVRRTNYACCALDYLAAFVEADNFGTKECARKNRRLWLYMLFAKKVMDATPLEGETGKCGTLAFATKVAKKADCFCSSCDCENDPYPPPPDPCAIPVTYNVKAAVDADQQDAIEIAGPAVGDAYYISTETSSIGWLINTIQIWNGAGWDVVIPNDGDVTLTQAGVYWTALGGTNLPGLLFPTITAVWQGYPYGYAVQTNFPQISQYAGRPITIEVLSPGGWFPVLAFPNEAAIVSPVALNAQGYYIEDIRVVYNYATCPYISGAATVEPPIGCGLLSATPVPEAVCGTFTFNVNAFIGAADGFILGNVVATEIETGVIQTIPAVLGDNIMGPFSYLNSVSIVITNDRDAECNATYGPFTHPIYPFDATKVYAAVDANQENASIPGASYLIVSNVDSLTNTWSMHVGEYWNGSAWVVPADEEIFRSESEPNVNLSYWQISGGVAMQVFPAVRLRYNTVSEVWEASLSPLIAPFVQGVNIVVEYQCGAGSPVELYNGLIENFVTTYFSAVCPFPGISGTVTYNLDCPIVSPSVSTQFTPSGEVEPFPVVGLNNEVSFVFPQTDGKFICVGFFTAYDVTPALRVTRLNADGTLDTGFNMKIGTGSASVVRAAAVDSLGRVYVCGDFLDFNGNTTYKYLVRLLPDGDIDTTFTVGTSFNNIVQNVMVQADDKVIILGDFTTYNGTPASRIVRLNTNGSIDGTFVTGAGFNGAANAPAGASLVDSDGSIIISSGGSFSTYDGVTVATVPQRTIIRLDTNGALIETIAQGTRLNGTINDIAVQTDGKLIVTGSSSTYNGTAIPNIVRLNTDGTIDAAFNATLGVGYSGTTTSATTLPNGQILIGNGASFQGNNTFNLTRLNANGSRDSSYVTGPGFNGSVTQTVIMPSGAILVSGNFTTYDGLARIRVALLN